ncbi:hypothetical protein, partial [Methanocalculus sp.]|uniref:hypothetical protein n=1 Tax=Methanocalculus sp. TaxID=2004547 RepID=UPI00271A37BB
MKKWFFIAIILCLIVPLLSGCTAAPETDVIIPETTPPTQVPVSPVQSPVIIVPSELQSIPITLSASPLTRDNALLLTFEMNARQISGVIPREGYSMMLIFFAYNTDQVSVGYSPATADEVRTSGIPYKTRSIIVYPENVITHQEQVPDMGSPLRIFNPDEPYV